MAKRNEIPVVSQERTDNLFFNRRGQLVLRIGFATHEREEDTHRTVEHMETSQNTFLSLVSLTQQGPGRTVLQTCDACEEEIHSLFRRNFSKIALSPAQDMARCCRCRASLCQRHFHVSRYDGQPRCRRCHRRHWWWECIIKPLVSIQIE